MFQIFSRPFIASLALCALAGAGAPRLAICETAPTGNRIERKGVVIDFSAASRREGAAVAAGEETDIRFALSDAHSHNALRGLRPGAWLDLGGGLDSGEGKSCKEKVQSYLKGGARNRPLVDLTSYFVLAFNADASISVIDPLGGVAGAGNLFATIALNKPSGDWALAPDRRRLFVTLPEAGQVAVIDTESFKLETNIDVGGKPMRVSLQPDGRYVWIGDDSDTPASGVIALDPRALKIAARVATGKGHHELAFSDDSRLVFATNRDGGAVSVIDVVQLQKAKDVATGALPISLAYSKMAQALYVAEGATGRVSVIDGVTFAARATVETQPGAGPLRITPDGRWALLVNPKENKLHVIEIATNRLAQNISVGARPYQIAFSDAFAYVRSLDSEHVAMVSLSALGSANAEQLSTFPAGSAPPRDASDLGLGASMTQAVGEAAAMVVNPAENLIYYYMEGMLAPTGSFKNPGHNVRGVEVVDRGLRETSAGNYTARVKLPSAGNYNVALLIDSPQLVECFHLTAAPNAALVAAPEIPALNYLDPPTEAKVGDTVRLRFRLRHSADGRPESGVKDARVLYYAAPGLMRAEASAREGTEGIYEADLKITRPGAYYIYVGIASQKLKYGDLPYHNLRVID